MKISLVYKICNYKYLNNFNKRLAKYFNFFNIITSIRKKY